MLTIGFEWSVCKFRVIHSKMSAAKQVIIINSHKLEGSLNWCLFSDSRYCIRCADKSLARPDLKKQLKGRHFSSDAEVIAAAETWLNGQPSEFFLSGLQKLRVWSLQFVSFLVGLRTYQHPGTCVYEKCQFTTFS